MSSEYRQPKQKGISMFLEFYKACEVMTLQDIEIYANMFGITFVRKQAIQSKERPCYGGSYSS